MPRSTLVVDEHPVPRSMYPFIDVHSHHWNVQDYSSARMDSLVADMDAMNMAIAVNLSGRNGPDLRRAVHLVDSLAPGRMTFFANVSFDGIDDPDWGERAANQLEQDVTNGALGLKIFKSLGMYITDSAGVRVETDDHRIDPVWEKCAELGIPVLIHTGDPAPFWQPHDQFNERWLELKERPRRKRPSDPSWDKVMGEQWNLFRRHPETTFISAHFGWLANDLKRLGQLLDELPNVYTETGAILAELGRQPRAAREFLIRYKDRVLFGKDSWAVDEYRVYFRAFETADEYFDYYRRRHGEWKIYGLDLPDDVLRHIYYKNALQIIPGLDRRPFPER